MVSNASLWDTLPLLPPADRPAQMVQNADEIPLNRSFMHLHVRPCTAACLSAASGRASWPCPEPRLPAVWKLLRQLLTSMTPSAATRC